MANADQNPELTDQNPELTEEEQEGAFENFRISAVTIKKLQGK